ncbi:MAG: S16 family serine protease, partial [Fidelibacterota bacterium]
KVRAAHRAGIKKVILPEKNRKDLEEIPRRVRSEMNFHFIKEMSEAIKLALMDGKRIN